LFSGLLLIKASDRIPMDLLNSGANPPCYSRLMEPAASGPNSEKPSSDPHRSLFWMFVSFMGISIPNPGQEERALRLLIIGVILFLLFVAAGILALFRLW